MKTYRINEIFKSIQGEGHRVGTPAIFIRFAGCNLNCEKASQGFDCDTDYSERMKLSLDQLEEQLWLLNPCPWVILTGGEPMMQVDRELVDRLHGMGFKVAVETNGTIPITVPFDWVSVSPKRGVPTKLEKADEIRLVLAAGEWVWPVGIKADHLFVSPAFDGMEVCQEAVECCVEVVLADLGWRLSVQVHKLIGVQ